MNAGQPMLLVLMARRRRGETGQPAWLDDRIYELVRKVCGWNE